MPATVSSTRYRASAMTARRDDDLIRHMRATIAAARTVGFQGQQLWTTQSLMDRYDCSDDTLRRVLEPAGYWPNGKRRKRWTREQVAEIDRIMSRQIAHNGGKLPCTTQ